MMIDDYRPLHARAVQDLDDLVATITPNDLARTTPCVEWDLRQLVAHLVGQHHGFAAAVRDTADVTVSAFAPRPIEGEDWRATTWLPSVADLREALASAPLDRRVLLPELSPTYRFRVNEVISFHFIDTLAHAWDVATALGRDYRPSDDLVAACLDGARRVPGGDARTSPGAAFGPVIEVEGDPWSEALGLLGRSVVSVSRGRGRVGA